MDQFTDVEGEAGWQTNNSEGNKVVGLAEESGIGTDRKTEGK